MLSVPLTMMQPAEAAGTFVPLSGNQVQITFTSANDPGPSSWTFVLTGANVVGGMCPSGGTLAVGVGGNPSEAQCSFGAATVSGSGTLVLDVPYSCTATITDWTSSPAAGTIQEPPITCTTDQTTTTTVPATTTTTLPPTTTTTLGPCNCLSLVVSVSAKTVTISHLSSSSSSSSVTRVQFRVSWTLTCSQGLGHCSARVITKSPSGESTSIFRTPPVSSGGGHNAHVTTGHVQPGIGLTCSGPCSATTTGSFYVRSQSKSSIAGKTLAYVFFTTCSGQQHSQTIQLVFKTDQKLDLKKSTVGTGKKG